MIDKPINIKKLKINKASRYNGMNFYLTLSKEIPFTNVKSIANHYQDKESVGKKIEINFGDDGRLTKQIFLRFRKLKKLCAAK